MGLNRVLYTNRNPPRGRVRFHRVSQIPSSIYGGARWQVEPCPCREAQVLQVRGRELPQVWSQDEILRVCLTPLVRDSARQLRDLIFRREGAQSSEKRVGFCNRGCSSDASERAIR